MRSCPQTSRVLYLLIGILLVSQCTFLDRGPTREAEPAKWERFFFPIIDASTAKSGLTPLREKPLGSGELEVRIWRGFGLSPLEGVVLARAGTLSSGVHILSNDPVEITEAQVNQLNEPKNGWGPFWESVGNMGLFRMDEAADEACSNYMVDGRSYVVEISTDGVYRTYMYQTGMPDCENSVAVDKIGDFVGEQFYDGTAECKTGEWFACSELLRRRRENGEGN